MGSACPQCDNFDAQDDSPLLCSKHTPKSLTYAPKPTDKFVKLRNGMKAELIHEIYNVCFPIIGRCGKEYRSWRNDGSCGWPGSKENDIIGPWEEPFRIETKVKWCRMDDFGVIYPMKLEGVAFMELVGKRGTLIFVEDEK